MTNTTTATVANITSAIHTIRGLKVILDKDLARIYGVTTKRLNEQVKRNAKRFPTDFLFQLTAEELDSLRSQIATLKTGRGQQPRVGGPSRTGEERLLWVIVKKSPTPTGLYHLLAKPRTICHSSA